MNKCLVCGKDIPDFSIYCGSPKCQKEYEQRVMIAHCKREYREYIFWHYYTIDHLNDQ